MSDGPGHEIDVFVSFAADDDAPLQEGDPGLVSLFCDSLNQLARIDLDRDLSLSFSSAEDAGSPEAAALFLAVLSPGYAESFARTVELKKFIKAVGADDAAERVFAIVREPTDTGGVLDFLRGVKTYDLFDAGGDVTRARLNGAAGSLAEDIAAALSRSAVDAEPTGPRRTVFLARTDPGTGWARERVRDELESRGFVVEPRGPLAWDPEDPDAVATITREIGATIAESELSVHILGDRYHDPANLELGIAAELSASAGPERYVWIAPEGDPADPRLRSMFDAVETAPRGTRFFRRTSIDSFVSALIAALEDGPTPRLTTRSASNGHASPAPVPVAAGDDVATPDASEPERESTEVAWLEASDKYVYLLYEPTDERQADRLRRSLQKAGHEVWIPLFSDDSNQNGLQHRQYLENCDASLVVYGEAPSDWWHALQVQWKKLRYWRQGAQLPRGFYFLEPFTPEKLGVRGSTKKLTVVIRGQERFSEDQMRPFLDLLGVESEPEG